ncbi:MAG: zinc ribbon domain-containing protein [Oscillospiraceae bacterium]|nr:zinc ribbon domain-containing protein [Oscillospiraceae bacterium]
MAECVNCKIEVLDETELCPLCRSILRPTDAVENMYPDVRIKMQKFKLVANIYLFCALCVEGALVALNILLQWKIWWSIVIGLALGYVYLVLRYAVLGKSGYRSKILLLSLVAVLAAVAADMAIGYRGWSVEYVLPMGIAAVDMAIGGCMIFNRRSWQSYMMWQLWMVAFSLIPAHLYFVQRMHSALFAFLPLLLSCALFLGTLIIGDRRARTELKRRFHF